MNAPLLFILLPASTGMLAYLLFPVRQRLVIYSVSALSVFLAWLALFLPLETPFSFLGITVPVVRAWSLFGRQFVFEPSMRPALFFLCIGCAAMFFGSLAISWYRRFLPVGLLVQALLIASLFVEPFLYAAVFLLLAVCCLSLLLSDSSHPEPRGALRWITFTALGVPFLLLAGTELSFRSGQPIDPAHAHPIVLLLSIGFGLFLSFPPFHFWLPDVADDSPPYSVAFILSVYSGGVVFFLLRFLDSFSWLRAAPETYQILQLAGTAMCILGGALCLAQRRFGRMVGYLSLINLGAILLSVSVANPAGVETSMVLLATRGFGLIVWGVSFHSMRSGRADDSLKALRGYASEKPFSCTAAILAGLSLAGLPGLFSFPGYWATLRLLADSSLSAAASFFPLFSLLLAMAAGAIACLRFARSLLSASIRLPFSADGGRLYRLLLGLSLVSFFILGLLPQAYLPALANAAKSFTNLMSVQ